MTAQLKHKKHKKHKIFALAATLALVLLCAQNADARSSVVVGAQIFAPGVSVYGYNTGYAFGVPIVGPYYPYVSYGPQHIHDYRYHRHYRPVNPRHYPHGPGYVRGYGPPGYYPVPPPPPPYGPRGHYRGDRYRPHPHLRIPPPPPPRYYRDHGVRVPRGHDPRRYR